MIQISNPTTKTSMRKRESGEAEPVFTVELDALYKHLNRRVKKENLAVVKGNNFFSIV